MTMNGNLQDVMCDMTVKEYNSPVGRLYLAATGDGLCFCGWREISAYPGILKHLEGKGENGPGSEVVEKGESGPGSEVIEKAERELQEYFEGKRRSFDIPLKAVGTDFQKRVWDHLSDIPYGETVSYTALARLAGLPKGARAVANACARNPLSIFVPCHRVVSARGELTGYAGGVEAKGKLLSHEHTVK